MKTVEVIEDSSAATVALKPLRAQMLAQLREPMSAAGLAEQLSLPRQKVNYHLRELESHGLVRLAGERRHGGITERLLEASAAAYVVSPGALGESAVDPARVADRLSARFLIALAARLIREVAGLVRKADGTEKRVATLAIDTEIGFASGSERQRFAEELTQAITELAARYHHDDGRPHRLIVASHPTPKVTDD